MSIVSRFLFILFFSVIFSSCKTISPDRLDEEAVHQKDPLELWILTGSLHTSDSLTNMNYIFVIQHVFNSENDNDVLTAFLIMVDLVKKTYQADMINADLKSDSISLILPLKFEFDAQQRKWKWYGKDGSFRIKAAMDKLNGNALKLRTVKESARNLFPDSFAVEADGAKSFYYPLLNIKGKVKVESKNYKVDGVSQYWRIWNARDFLSITQRVFQLFIATGNETYAITGKLDNKGALLNYDLYSIENNTSDMKKINRVDIKIVEYWKSLQTGKVYPMIWRIEFPELNRSILIKPDFAKQEMTLLKSPLWMGFAKTIIKDQNVELMGSAVMMMN